MTKKWYAVYTKPHCEKKVASLLAKKKFEAYCPMIGTMKEKGIVYQPLLPCYIFVYASNEQLKKISKAKNVINFLYWLNKPVVINSDEIAATKHFVHDNENIKLEKIEKIVNNKQSLVGNPKITIEERMIPVKNKMVRVLHTALGVLITAEVEEVTTETIYKARKEKNVFLRHYDDKLKGSANS
jgi:transcription antitermination factor NusG